MHTRHDDPGTATTTLRADHDLILRALAILERFGRCLDRGEPVDREGLEWLSDFFTTFVDRCHHGKEEQHLPRAPRTARRHACRRPDDSCDPGKMRHSAD